MRIDPARRRAQYLAALGIDQWVVRSTPQKGCTAGATSLASSAVTPALTSAPISVITPAQPQNVPMPAPVESVAWVPARDWSGLQAEVASCRRCPLHVNRTQAVFGSGRQDADWMVVGEAPGSEEDRRGEPFVGAAGQLLTAMLAAIDLPRQEVFITNVLKCRPPDNRDPKPAEMAQCIPYLAQQIDLVKPKIILAFGRFAAQNLLGVEQPLSRLRGQVHRIDPGQTPVIVTYHPAYLLRVPADKRKAWEDLKFARRSFNDLMGTPSASTDLDPTPSGRTRG